MRLHAVVAVLLASHVAAAQPGATPPGPGTPPLVLPEGQQQPPPPVTPQQTDPQSQPQGQPQPQPVATAQLTMSEKDVEILKTGEISHGRQIIGGLFASTIGLGIGQIVERRWGDSGWIFTLGEAGSIGLFGYGVVQAVSADGHYGGWMILGSVVIYTGLRVWGIVDAFSGPGRHNRRYRELRDRTNGRGMFNRVGGYVTPTDRGGGVGGISLVF